MKHNNHKKTCLIHFNFLTECKLNRNEWLQWLIFFLKHTARKGLHLSITITACFSVPFSFFLFDHTAVTLMDQHEQPVGPCKEAPDKGKVFLWLPKQEKVLGRPDRRADQRKAARAVEGFQSHCPLAWLWTKAALMICKATGGSVNLSVGCQRVWWDWRASHGGVRMRRKGQGGERDSRPVNRYKEDGREIKYGKRERNRWGCQVFIEVEPACLHEGLFCWIGCLALEELIPWCFALTRLCWELTRIIKNRFYLRRGTVICF